MSVSEKIYADIDSNDLSDDQHCGNSDHNFYRVILPPSSHQTIIIMNKGWWKYHRHTITFIFYAQFRVFENVILLSIPDSMVGQLFAHFVWEERFPIRKNILNDRVVILL